MTRREKERKIKMFGMIGMSIFLIGSLTTASYAWFVSRNKATVQVTNLTIADVYSDYIIYEYTENNDTHGYRDPLTTYDFSEHFEPLAQDASLSASALYPGQSLTYCLELTPIANSVATTFTFQVQKYSCARSENALVEGEVETITLAYAIEIRAAAYTCLESQLDAKEEEFFTDDLDDRFNHGAEDITDIVSGDFNSSLKSYIFFTITFSDDPGTYFAASSGESGGNSYNYVKDDDGNSNIYEGMDFTITAIHVEVA